MKEAVSWRIADVSCSRHTSWQEVLRAHLSTTRRAPSVNVGDFKPGLDGLGDVLEKLDEGSHEFSGPNERWGAIKATRLLEEVSSIGLYDHRDIDFEGSRVAEAAPQGRLLRHARAERRAASPALVARVQGSLARSTTRNAVKTTLMASDAVGARPP